MGETVQPLVSLRKKRIISALRLDGNGIEYGPLHKAIVPKSGCSVKYVDYTDKKGLAEHYANDPNVDVNLIPEIDIVTGGRRIVNFVDPDSIDFVVASHVLEHVPDFLTWLEDNMTILKVGGRVGVAYPDRRYCFDLKRQPSKFSEMIAATLELRTKPSFSQLCDHFFNVANAKAKDIWDGSTTADNAPYVFDRKSVVGRLREMQRKQDYIDAHCWIFADHELLDLLTHEINDFMGGRIEVISFFKTTRGSNEFYFTLERIR